MNPNKPHLVTSVSDRGFKYMPPVPSTHGDEVRVYESSAADGPHLWLRITDSASKNHDAVTHLTVENALRLADQIRFLAANHYQEQTTTLELPEPVASAEFGTAVIRRLADGTVVVDHADRVIGITRELLAKLREDGLGRGDRICLDTAGEYQYAFHADIPSPQGFKHDVLVYRRMHVAQCSSQGSYPCRGCACWCHEPIVAKAVQ